MMHMKKMLALLAGVLLSGVVSAQQVEVINVVDGDTLRITADFLPPQLGNTLLLRIAGLDTPEKGYLAKCQSERDASVVATEATKKFLSGGTPIISLQKWDKYGGRVLGDVEVNRRMLSVYLISNGYARPYNGERKSDWCNNTK